MKFKLFILGSCLLFASCTSSVESSRSSDGYYMAFIEIPAGTNKKMEMDKSSGVLKQDLENGEPRVISYLPYPGNYGFVPGTKIDEDQGGDGDALDVLILCESLPMGEMIEFEPIAMLKLNDEGEIDNKIIGVPVDEELNILGIHSFYDFQVKCKECPTIIRHWFENYSKDEVLFRGWEDEEIASSEIERWSID